MPSQQPTRLIGANAWKTKAFCERAEFMLALDARSPETNEFATGGEDRGPVRGRCFGPEHLRQNLRCRRGGSYLYVNNAKAACSTIKLVLWHRAYDRGEIAEQPVGNRVHLRDLPLWGPMDPTNAEDTYAFTFVRNPFSRILSSYFDKVALRPNGTCRPPGKALRQRFGLAPNVDLSFRDFLRLIIRLHPAEDDPHWRPQVDNVFFNRIRLDYIGKVENYDYDVMKVFSRLFGDPDATKDQWTPHATNAQKKLAENYGPVETRLILAKYAEDFRAFNYPMDPLDTTNAPVLERSSADPLLTALVGAEARRARGDIQGAIDALLPQAEARPEEPDAAHFLGQLYKTAGSNGEAAKWLDQAVDTAVGRPGVFTKAAMLHSQLGNRDAAAKITALGLKEFPYNTRLRQQAEQIGDNTVFERAELSETDTQSSAAKPGVQALGRSARSVLRHTIGKLRA